MDKYSGIFAGAVSLYFGYHAIRMYKIAKKAKYQSSELEKWLEQERELNKLLRRKDKKAYFARVDQIRQAKSFKQSQEGLSSLVKA